MAHSTSINNNTPAEDKGQADLSCQCPKCKSPRVRIGYPDIQCLSCGWSEPLIDFPVSHDWHRHYCQEYGLPDLGSCEPPEHTLDELGERIKALEEQFAGLSREELRALGFGQLKEEIDQLKLGLRYTQRLIPRKPAKNGAPKKVVTTEV